MSVPVCKKCGQPMKPLGEDLTGGERWYCFKDDLIYLTREGKWSDREISAPPQKSSIITKVGTRKQGIMRGAGVDLLLSGIAQTFFAFSAVSTLNTVQDTINQYSAYYSQSEIYSTQIQVPLADAATQHVATGLGGLIFGLICLGIMFTRNDDYSRGWWLSFGSLNAIGGAAYFFVGKQLQAVGSVNMSVGDIVNSLQGSLYQDVMSAVILFLVALLLMHVGAKREIVATPTYAPVANQLERNVQWESTDTRSSTKSEKTCVELSNSKFCRYCGGRIPRTSKFCEECGKKVA